jgi:hypothetical protein
VNKTPIFDIKIEKYLLYNDSTKINRLFCIHSYLYSTSIMGLHINFIHTYIYRVIYFYYFLRRSGGKLKSEDEENTKAIVRRFYV